MKPPRDVVGRAAPHESPSRPSVTSLDTWYAASPPPQEQQAAATDFLVKHKKNLAAQFSREF